MNGFTLIEVLIAIFLLVIGIVGVLAMFPLAVQTTKSAQLASVATQLAQAKIEEMVSKSYDDPVFSTGTSLEGYGDIANFPFYKRITKVACADPADLSEVDCDTGLKKVEVTVLWKSPLGVLEKSVKIATLIAKK